MVSWAETMKHEVDHGNANHRLAAGGQGFVILTEAPVLAQSRERALHNPSFGQHHEMADRRPSDNLDHASVGLLGPLDQLTGVPAIGPDELQPMKAMRQPLQDQPCAVSVLDVGGMHHDHHHEAQRVHHDMPLASRDFLARVVPTIPPFSAVFTDWESMIAAEGVGVRPALRRTFSRSRS